MEVMRRRRSPCSGRRRRSTTTAVAVGRRVRELRRLVPGAAAMPADRLLVRTADYIAQLRARVELLKALSELCVPREGHGHGAADGHAP
ncbi:transcription factor bHLH150-like [Brachypodium distachyon]|uniref:BHLH domain-containing protein n=1 Tax=Brachypodium distachyon TaxID=15368 RepID=A0A2K2CR49_BRADI|nr:transcription factor bHLH150-like [Brachypodium distachyon]PNT64499.1 hypothetical protein BRADI_4g29326v3 [Brachypodium distachyon]|eukprot:XP_024310810.1 transcription factor bHLH150-like [Brachypodium distachyon]